MVDISYKPLIPVNIKDVQAPTKIDTPDYPDKGTTYAGYSKTLYSGNTYQLNPQTQEDLTYTVTCTGGETQHTLANPFLNDKNFYVTKILLYVYRAPGVRIGGQRIRIGDSNIIRVTLMENVVLDYDAYDLNFDQALFFNKTNNVVLDYSTSRTAGDVFVINLVGWTE